jgi:hypothetical protein
MDMTHHLQDLNLQLQQKTQMVNNMFNMKYFEVKLYLWEIQLCTFQLHCLNAAKYAIEAGVLKGELKSRFQSRGYMKHLFTYMHFLLLK